MLTTKECRKYILQKDLSDEQIEELQNTLAAIIREIIKKNIKKYESKGDRKK